MALHARQELRLETAGGVHFSIPLAGPIARAVAWLIDAIVATGVAGLVSSLLSLVGGISRDRGIALQVLGAFAVQILYSIYFEWRWRGQTLGKRMLGLRVIDAHGFRLTLAQVVVRNLLRMADQLPLLYVVGGVGCLLSRRAQRLGDLAAGTVVTLAQSSRLKRFFAPTDSHYNSIREQPRLIARLRQVLSPEQARILLEAAERRDQLEPEARIELFAELAQGLKQRVAFPEASLLGLSDERLVVNVVECLFSEQ